MSDDFDWDEWDRERLVRHRQRAEEEEDKRRKKAVSALGLLLVLVAWLS